MSLSLEDYREKRDLWAVSYLSVQSWTLQVHSRQEHQAPDDDLVLLLVLVVLGHLVLVPSRRSDRLVPLHVVLLLVPLHDSFESLTAWLGWLFLGLSLSLSI